MKNNDRLLKVLGDVRDDLIPDAESKKKKSKTPLKLAAGAAVTAAAVAGLFAAQNMGDIIDLIKDNQGEHGTDTEISFNPPSGGLPKISRGEISGGFEVYLYHDISEYTNMSPWNESIQLSELPVYKNLAYNGSATPIYFDEDKMTKMAENAAEALGLSVFETEGHYSGKNEDNLYGITAVCSGEAVGLETVEISVDSDGSINVNFVSLPLDGGSEYGLPIPEEYVLETGNSESSDSEATETVNYLTDRFKDLLGFKNPSPDTYNDSYQSDLFSSYSYRIYAAYDKSENIAESILNYSLARAVFSSNSKNMLGCIYLDNYLSSSEYMGGYPVISLEEAKNKLIGGDFISVFGEDDVKGGKFGEDVIVKTELVYLSYRQEYFQPFYKFFVELNETPYGSSYDESLIPYGAFYVHAVKDEFFFDENEKTDISEDLQGIRYTLSDYPISYTLTEHYGNGIRIAEDISLLEDLNPWNEELKIDSLPVYEMFNLTDTQMNELLKDTAKKMGLTLKDSSFVKNQSPNADLVPYNVLMGFCEGEYRGISDITITVYGTGDVGIRFHDDGYGEDSFIMPDEYSIDHSADESDKARAGLEYLVNEFADLLSFRSPVLNSYTESRSMSYANQYAEEMTAINEYKYRVYEDSENTAEKILNYNLAYAEFDRSVNSIRGVTLTNKLFASEKLGDYPIITADEARELLLDGKYLIPFSKDYIKDGGLKAEDVKKVELVYRFSESRYLVPYYRFYAEIEAVPIMYNISGAWLKEYGEFYVPAIRSEYIAGDPYAKKRDQAVIDSYYYDKISLPDGSTLSPSEASETFGSTSSPGLIFDFAFMRYAEPVFSHTIDDPDIYDFDTFSFNVSDEDLIYISPDYFKVQAGDVLQNGLTVKSASFGIECGGGQNISTSKITLDGEITIEGILGRQYGAVLFYPDPAQNPIPLSSGRKGEEDVIANYLTDLDGNFALVTDGGTIYPKNDFNTEDILGSGNYVKGRLTLRDITYLCSDYEDMQAAGMVYDDIETAEFVSFEAER
ncbi:MAG: hypothetical protein HDT47_04180 [Ruminococcaceae bacterium]|nr:hypothetical protein [Oscillospiraceae bacterium]